MNSLVYVLSDLGNDMWNQPQDVAGKNEIQVELGNKPKVENIPGNCCQHISVEIWSISAV